MLWQTTAAIDTPATIAILGVGPLALEAALYARYLGYDARLFAVADSGDMSASHEGGGAAGEGVAGDQPFGALCSKLGLAALHAQDPRWQPPTLTAAITAAAWRSEYLAPLAASDLLVDIASAPPLLARIESHAGCTEIDEANSAAADARDEHSGDTESGAAESGEEESGNENSDDAESGNWDSPAAPHFQISATFPGSVVAERVLAQLIIDASSSHSSPGGWESAAIERQPFAGVAISRRAPHFYRIEAASDCQATGAFQRGLGEIRALFALIGGREALDLYATMDHLLP